MLLKALFRFLRLLASWKRGRTPGPAAVRNILLVELTGLGDLVTMLCAIEPLLRRFPNAKINLLVAEAHVGLLQASTLPVTVHGTPPVRGTKTFLRAVVVARALHADLAISMSTPRKNAAVTLASGSSSFAGYLSYRRTLTPYLHSTPVEGYGIRLETSQTYAREPLSTRAGKICRALGADIPDPDFRLCLRPEIARQGLRKLQGSGAMPGQPFVAIHPFASWRFRSWPSERFTELAKRISANLGMRIVFQFATREQGQWDAAFLAASLPEGTCIFASNNLIESALMLASASLFIGNDSGPLHLASALGAKTIGLHGPAPPALTAPPSRFASSVYHAVDCSPCDQRQCVRPSDPCMSLLTVDEVYFMAVSRLEEVKKGEVHSG